MVTGTMPGRGETTVMWGRKEKASASRDWLGAEIELMLRERERLLQAAGAAAALFATLDIRDLPSEARQSLCTLGATLASLSDETLSDAMERVVGGAARTVAHT
jgi:hypothetical protein